MIKSERLQSEMNRLTRVNEELEKRMMKECPVDVALLSAEIRENAKQISEMALLLGE